MDREKVSLLTKEAAIVLVLGVDGFCSVEEIQDGRSVARCFINPLAPEFSFKF
jgi:hypothetical protein